MDNSQDQDHKDDFKENNEADQKIYPHQLPLETLYAWFIGILNGKAWEYLGLMMNPDTKESTVDLKKAKISIDSIEFLLNQIHDRLELDDKKQLENLLANLQMNYVEKYKESKKPSA